MRRVALGLIIFFLSEAAFTQNLSPRLLKSQPAARTAKAAPAKPNPWILNFLSYVDLYQKNELDNQWQELKFGYKVLSQLDVYLDWGYSGRIQSTPMSYSEIWDPEIFFDYRIPLTSEKNLEQWNLLTSASIVTPAAGSTINSNLISAESASVGVSYHLDRFTIVESNRGYVSFYTDAPTFIPFFQTEDGSNSIVGVNPDSVLNTSPSHVYYNTSNMLRFVYEPTDKISGKIETWLNMAFDGTDNVPQRVLVVATAGYFLTPHLRVFGGLTSNTQIDKAKKPPLFTPETTALRLGFYLKW
jgi:hypothetical protein